MSSRGSARSTGSGWRSTGTGRRARHRSVLLHGWPGNRHDYRRVVPLLTDAADVIVPDLRGFGGSDKHAVDVRHFYSASAQASSVVGLIHELGTDRCRARRLRRGQPHRAECGADVSRPGAGRWCCHRRCPESATACSPAGAAQILVSGVSPTAAGRPADRRQPRRRPRVPAPFLEPLVRPEFHVSPRTIWTGWPPTTRCPAHSPLRSPGIAQARAWSRSRLPSCRQIGRSRSRHPPTCYCRNMIRCFRGSGPIGSSDYFVDAKPHTVDGVGHFTPLECPREFASLILDRVSTQRAVDRLDCGLGLRPWLCFAMTSEPIRVGFRRCGPVAAPRRSRAVRR